MDAVAPADAENAPTETWKTAENAVFHSAHTLRRFQEKEEPHAVNPPYTRNF